MTLTALLATRDRPDALRTCLQSLEAADRTMTVCVLDQSDGDESARVMAGLDLPNLRWIRCATRGRSKTIIQYWDQIPGDVLAIVDDDTTVTPEWPAVIREAFAEGTLDVLLGRMLAGRPLLPGEQLTRRDRKQPFEPRGRLARFASHGVGGAMAFRRDALARIGGFDPLLGPGGRFPGHDDFDLVSRALKAGLRVRCIPAYTVHHWGFRNERDGSAARLLTGYSKARGATAAKSLKLGDWVGVAAEWRVFLIWLAAGRPFLRRAKTMKLTRGWHRAFLRGFASGLRSPVDRRTRCFRDAG